MQTLAKIGENWETHKKTIKINQKWTNLYQVNPNWLESTKMDSNWVKIEEDFRYFFEIFEKSGTKMQ